MNQNPNDIKYNHGKKWLALALSFSTSLFSLYFFTFPILFVATILVLFFAEAFPSLAGFLSLGIIFGPFILVVYKFYSITNERIIDLIITELAIQGDAIVLDINKSYEDPLNEKIKNAFLKAKKALNFDTHDVLLVRATDNNFNAFALSNLKKESAIVVFDGVAHSLNDDQLQAVVGHEIGHIMNHDSSQKVLMFASQYYIPYAKYYSAIVSQKIVELSERYDSRLSLLLTLLLFVYKLYSYAIIFALWITNFINAFAYKQAEYLADYHGAKSSSYASMIEALQIIQRIEESYTDHHESILLKMLAEHPETSKRIKYLEEISAK